MILKQESNFNREIRRLTALYNASLMTFPEKAKNLKEHLYKPDYKPQDKIYLNDIQEEHYLLANNSYELINKFKSGYSKTLREVIIIRAISALEVLLIDLVRETFIHKKYLFHSGQKIEFSQSELLSSKSITNVWSKIINKECRNLQNQGFKQITKYYKKSFGIEFSNGPVPLSQIQYIHDIRHLLVHRLGKTDSIFRHTYNENQPTIELSERVFYESVNKILNFGSYVCTQVANLLLSPTTLNATEIEIRYKLKPEDKQNSYELLKNKLNVKKNRFKSILHEIEKTNKD